MDSNSTGIYDMMIMVMMTMIVMMIMSLMVMIIVAIMVAMLTVKLTKEMMMMMFDELIALCINSCLQSSQSTNLPTVPCHDIRFDMHS